jgi:probable F420-dependent oxidoreductase
VTQLGIAVGGDLTSVGAVARLAEDAGFESVWVAETARSAFSQAGVVAQATEGITIGTAIALAFPRSPAITAMEARDLDELSGGRFILGLGSQVKRVNEQRFGVPFEHPAPKMRDYILAVRAVLASFDGSAPDHRGPFYEITMAPFPGASPPLKPLQVYLAAVNERMAEVAGEVADGIQGHPMTSPRWVNEVIRPAVERGARKAGRDPSSVSLTTNVILQLADDPEVARREAAGQLAFYATTRTYAPVLEMHGFGDRVDPLREAFGRGDLAGMVDLAMPLVDTLAIAGDARTCRERLEAFDGVVDRVVIGSAWVGTDPSRVAQNLRQVLGAFGASA